MYRKTIFYVSFYALFLALFVIFSYVPYIGYIKVGPISFTTMHILVLVGALLFGKWTGAVFGLFMGVLSLLVSLQYPGFIDYLFLNPFVSILPRVLFGFIAGLVFDLLRKKTTFTGFLTVTAPLCGILTLLHTVLTLSCLYVFAYLDIFYITRAMDLTSIIEENISAFGSFGNFIATFITPGAVCETAAAIILSPSIMAAIYKFVIKKNERIFSLNVRFRSETDTAALSRNSLITITVILAFVVIALAGLVLFLFYHFN